MCGQPNKFYSQETLKYSNSSMTPLNENFTSALNYPLHNFCCKKPRQHYTGITTATHTYVYRTNGNTGLHSLLAIQFYKTSLSIPAWLHMDNLSQICQELVQMSIKTHLQYWGIPVKHNITVKVTNHLNHTDFLKNIQLCASCPITSSRTVLPLWKWVPTVLAQLMV